jgi:TetR/AcrR family tetracycline transcriptional repressor
MDTEPNGPAIRKGRGDRSHREGLTRERVLAKALVVIDREGLDALTMRRLADELGVTPMALYNHVRDKQDLLQGIAANLLDQVNFSSDDPDWRGRIRAGFRELRRACLAHSGAIRVMEAVEVAPLSIFGLLEVTLAALDEIGMSAEVAMRSFTLLSNFTLGLVSYELRGPFKALDPVEARHAHRFGDAGFVHTERVAAFDNWDFDRAFEFGLNVIISGLEQRSTT